MNRTMNLGINLSRNFNSVKAEILNHTFEADNEEDLQHKIDAAYENLKATCERQFDSLGLGVKR